MRPSAVAGATAAVPGTPRPPLSGTRPAAAGTLPTAAGSRTGSQSRCCSTWPAGILVRWGGGGSLAGADACMHPGGSCGRAGSSTAASIQHSRRAECACLPACPPACLTCSRLQVPQYWCEARANTFASATQRATSASSCSIQQVTHTSARVGRRWRAAICLRARLPGPPLPFPRPAQQQLNPWAGAYHFRAAVAILGTAACFQIVPYEECRLLLVWVPPVIAVEARIPASTQPGRRGRQAAATLSACRQLQHLFAQQEARHTFCRHKCPRRSSRVLMAAVRKQAPGGLTRRNGCPSQTRVAPSQHTRSQ